MQQTATNSQTQPQAELRALIAELVNSQDQLLALYDLAQAMRQQLDLEAALTQLVTIAAQVLRIETTAVILMLPDRSTLISQHPVCNLKPEIVKDWLHKVQATGTYLLQNQPSGFDNLLLLPIHIQDQVAGALVYVNKQGNPLASPDRKLGQAIANQAGIYLENILFYEQSLSETRLQTELKLARDVQTHLLPQRPPCTPGLDIWAGSEPARQVGGDWFDFVTHSKQCLHFCVGDVSGKGMSAALLMSMTRTTIRNALRFDNGLNSAQIVDYVNTALYDDFTEVGMFATLFVGRYDSQERRLRYANAGHSPVIYRPAHGTARLLEADDVPVGVFPDSVTMECEFLFEPGDLLVVCTDGFNEAQNSSGDLFGLDNLLQLVDDLAEQPATEIGLGLVTAVANFAHNQPQADDQTLVVCKGVM